MAKILIVDDEYTIAETLSEILSFEGHEPTAASNGVLGLEAMEKSRPDLVLLDYMMPVMDGVKLLQAMRKEPRFSGLRVIMMTAAPERALAGQESLWDGFLRKPFDSDELIALVNQVLSKPRSAAREL